MSTKTSLPPRQIRCQCLEILFRVADKWRVSPALVVAHCRCGRVCKARLEVMRAMFRLGLKRHQIAAAFGRDARRVRSSVIGGPPRNPNRIQMEF